MLVEPEMLGVMEWFSLKLKRCLGVWMSFRIEADLQTGYK